MSRHPRRAGALATFIVCTLLATAGIGPVAAVEDYPTWDDVQSARQNEAATMAAIGDIEAILIRLESQANELGRISLKKGEVSHQATEALDAATARTRTLTEQARAAAARAAVSSQRAGQLIAQIARTGGGSLTLELLLSPNADDLLGSLGAMSKVSEQASAIYRQAQVDANLVTALTAQATVAQTERAALAAQAKVALEEALKASDAAFTRVTEQRAASEQLYAQLATLKGTTASIEQDYLAGLADQAAGGTPPTPAPTSGPTSPPGPTPTPGPTTPPPPPPPPAPSSGSVAGAIAFARAQIGDRYQFAGSGPDAWDCSGLTKGAYASVGVYIGTHSATNQYYTMANAGRLVPLNQMVAGDLIFYADGGNINNGGAYHVALYVGGGQMVEAPYAGVPVRQVSVRYYDMVGYAGRPTG